MAANMQTMFAQDICRTSRHVGCCDRVVAGVSNRRGKCGDALKASIFEKKKAKESG